jgi:hypothetical protein
LNQETEVVSTQIVACDSMCERHTIGEFPPAQALLIIFADGHVDVRCPLKGSGNSDKICVYDG